MRNGYGATCVLVFGEKARKKEIGFQIALIFSLYNSNDLLFLKPLNDNGLQTTVSWSLSYFNNNMSSLMFSHVFQSAFLISLFPPPILLTTFPSFDLITYPLVEMGILDHFAK